MTTLFSSNELAAAAHRLGVVPAVVRRHELITRAIHAAGPDGFARAGLALDGSTALLGVYLARHGILRPLAALEVAPVAAATADPDTFLEEIAAAVGAVRDGRALVFPEQPAVGQEGPEMPRLELVLSSTPLRFAPPPEARAYAGAGIGAIVHPGLVFGLHPTANPPLAVPVAYVEELYYRLLSRVAASSGVSDSTAIDDLACALEREPIETARVVGGPVLAAFRAGLAARGLDLAEALPSLRGRILHALTAGDRGRAAPPAWRLDAAAAPTDRVAIEQAALRALQSYGETER